MLVVLCVSWIRSQYFLHGYASVAQRANRAAARPRTVKEGTLTDHTARSAQHPRSKHWLLIGLAGLVIVIVGLLIFRFTPAGPLLRSAFDPTYKSNLERLEFAVRLIAPMTNLEALFGRGLGDVVEQNFRTVRVGLGAITEGASREVQLAKNRTLVDNQYLKTFVEMGLIGLLIYAWLFWRFAKGAWQLVREGGERHKKIIGLWSAGFLAAFVVQGFFIDIWDIFPTNAMFWIVGGLLAAALTPMRDEDLRHTDSSAKNRA